VQERLSALDRPELAAAAQRPAVVAQVLALAEVRPPPMDPVPD
jgi:hypothetical protein